MSGVPRIRGGVPPFVSQCDGISACSPHTRGCSSNNPAKMFPAVVFPAYAGVFLLDTHVGSASSRVPRIRGGVPNRTAFEVVADKCSPHTRGCSLHFTLERRKRKVFPAYAGVFPRAIVHHRWQRRVPRIRGGVPPISCEWRNADRCSPHTRGCSIRYIMQAGLSCSVPRIRGGVPLGRSS